MTALDRIGDYMAAHPGEWVSALALMQVGGLLSFRTRLSELRVQRGWRIDNRCRMVNGVKHSEYRYTAPAPTELPTWIEAHLW